MTALIKEHGLAYKGWKRRVLIVQLSPDEQKAVPEGNNLVRTFPFSKYLYFHYYINIYKKKKKLYDLMS